ncbi:pyruvate kinase [Saprospira grandis]|uniref:Pyruvate kinase n=1 Tax=Saprospira grandis (strain Lewin) TaxID=984262 RepID=H6L6K7_SAPGL|nr:pyruvate kinase [Saprospira grandis]AFC25253.1 pyruvate kinase [Saprospira grandis str. Lewin]
MEISKFQKTKILATIGPASNDYQSLLGLVKAGVDAIRLNFSHGQHEDHKKVFDYVQYINKKYGTNISILADLQGPKLRVGQMENGKIPLTKGQILTFTAEECLGTAEKVYMSYTDFAKDVKVGEKVLVDDGKVELLVKSSNGKDEVQLEVLYGDFLSSRKGVNLPDTNISQPSLTEKDLRDLDFILGLPFNWIALSFVRKAKDIEDLRKRLKKANHPARIIAKIEKPEAITNIDEIIAASDGVMVARGDLGVEVPMERLPMLQKMIIRKCIEQACPVIVATQMMDSMIKSPTPTRAEIIDVANAVLDGADTVMLSNETAMGLHPAKVVEAMNSIIAEAEQMPTVYNRELTPSDDSESFLSDAICYNACRIAKQVKAKMIIGMTKSGYTGFMVSSYRPEADVVVFSSDEHLIKTLNLVWGTRCYYYDKFTSTDDTIRDVVNILKEKGLLEAGDVIINTGSMPLHERKKTNMLKVTLVQ